LGERFLGGAYVSKGDTEVERAEVVECGYVDWAEGGGWRIVISDCRGMLNELLTEMDWR